MLRASRGIGGRELLAKPPCWSPSPSASWEGAGDSVQVTLSQGDSEEKRAGEAPALFYGRAVPSPGQPSQRSPGPARRRPGPPWSHG